MLQVTFNNTTRVKQLVETMTCKEHVKQRISTLEQPDVYTLQQVCGLAMRGAVTKRAVLLLTAHEFFIDKRDQILAALGKHMTRSQTKSHCYGC